MSENTKMMIRQGRQGDVLVTKLDKRVKDGRLKPIEPENGGVVLAHGEVTGHYHAVREPSGGNCFLFADDASTLTEDAAMSLIMRAGGGAVADPEADRILRVEDAPVELGHYDEHNQHQPSGDHGHFGIPIGDHEVRRQMEYDPDVEANRRIVAD
jgi:hypothetical protein